MFLSDSVVVRISGTALPTSLEESSKPAASAVGGPFPYTPVAKAVVAGIGCLFVAMSAGLFMQIADMTDTQVTPAMRISALRMVEEPLPAATMISVSLAARPLAHH